jgi:hypothetical protein
VPQSRASAATDAELGAARTRSIEATRTKGGPIRGEAAPPSIGGEGGYYYYAYGTQTSLRAGTSGMSALQTQQSPVTDPNDSLAHSLSQMWLLDWGANGHVGDDGLSDVEYGWSVDPPLFGSGGPHLFIFRFDGGHGTCYNGGSYYGCPTATNCPNSGPNSTGYPADNGWQQESSTEYPGELLTHDDRYHTYIAEDYNNNWWMYHDGTWMGFYGGCAWAVPITGYNELSAGGEVYSAGHATRAPSQMGNGQPGNTPNAAAWEQIKTTGQVGPLSLESYQSDPTQYTTGHWWTPTGEKSGYGPAFRYGGGAG